MAEPQNGNVRDWEMKKSFKFGLGWDGVQYVLETSYEVLIWSDSFSHLKFIKLNLDKSERRSEIALRHFGLQGHDRDPD